MGISVYQDTFSKRSGNGTQTISGLPFQPKALIFWTATMSGTTALDGWGTSYGFADGTNNTVVGTYARDNTADSTSGSTLNVSNCIYTWSSSNGVTDGIASAVLTSDGFTLTWTSSTATTHLIHYMAIGGTDITDVKTGVQTVGTATTGNKSYTPTTFQPDFLITANEGWIAASAYTDNQINAHLGIGISAMNSTTARWCITNVVEGGRTASDSWRYQRTDRCFAINDSTTGTKIGEADFISFDTNGWTWNYSVTQTNVTNCKYIYLAIKGGLWDVGSGTVGVTGTTSRTINTNANGTLKGVGFAFIGRISATTADVNAVCSLGGTDGTRQSCTTNSDLDAAATMANVKINRTTNVVYGLIANATATSSTVFSVGSLSSFGTSSFTTTWTNIDTTAYLYHYFALSEVAGGQLYDKPISEPSVSVSEALARVQVKLKPISDPSISVNESLTRIPNYLKTISDPSITVSETLTRVQTLIKTISETAVSISETLARIPLYLKPISETAITGSESLTRIPTYVKLISESAISINDTIVRLPLYLRPISETAITTNDIIARWISVSYTLAEPSITINDSIQGALFYLRQISESAISVSDTIARILIAIKAISDPSISINDTIARIQTLIKAISESAISINESVVRIPTFVKSISESTINTNDTIVRILAAVRTITDPSISVNDTITRIQTILKQISESAISVNDSLQAGLLITVSLVESRIKWYYSLLTRKIT